MNKVKDLTNLEKCTRLSLGEAMLMQISDEKSFSWKLIRNIVLAALSGHALEFTAICWGYTMGIRKLTRFAMSVDEFSTLKPIEQKALLLHNLDPMFNIKSGFFFQTDDVSDCLMQQLDRFSIFDVSIITR
jgi:hypothetical protein